MTNADSDLEAFARLVRSLTPWLDQVVVLLRKIVHEEARSRANATHGIAIGSLGGQNWTCR